MGKHRWNTQYKRFGDIWIKYDLMMSKIGPKDPETGCQYQLSGGTHAQGYMMMPVLMLDPAGDRVDPEGNNYRGAMTTGHRVLARIKYNCSLNKKDLVYHTCLNMRCLNPDHIEIGTYTTLQNTFTALGRTRHPIKGQPREVKMQKRAYKYSIPEMLLIKYARNKYDVVEQLGITPLEASNMMRYMQTRRFSWLDEYDPNLTDTPKEVVDIKKKS
jgi:hypothetical protein